MINGKVATLTKALRGYRETLLNLPCRKLENADFSNCYEMYLKKRFDSGREACDQYEEPEIIEIPDGEDINAYTLRLSAGPKPI